MDRRPIGVFDSGIGGLTVAAAIHELLPDESLVYFGDTAHLPYGDKSHDLIRAYATRITDLLLSEYGCKTIVIACNSASAAAYEQLRDHHKGSVPVINVIDPMIEAVIADDSVHHVGIIGTRATINAGIYQEKLSRRKPTLQYSALATPLLARMIEDGFHDNSVSRTVLNEYLSDDSLRGIDAIILACTHYPLIKDDINEFFSGKVKLFDSAQVAAQKLKGILAKEGLLTDGRSAKDRFLVSDYTESFAKTTKLFYSESIALEYSPIWGEGAG
jgi:glutamate racemase